MTFSSSLSDDGQAKIETVAKKASVHCRSIFCQFKRATRWISGVKSLVNFEIFAFRRPFI